jgi:4-amino-4-deoxy-L-arabinose transferase-like glycosyltransferase
LSIPNPALVAQRAVQRLPRIALLLFCAAYVVPGVFGRDPWKSADIAAFGAMVNVAEGRTGWLSPEVGGVPAEIAPLPYAIGAVFIRVLQPLLEPSLAARIPFALLLVATLVLTWYASFHLARSDAAQPLPFAFGGEANLIDYARTIADGAVLAVIATLGLLQLGHETTPELAQLAAAALFMYGLAASPYRTELSRLAVLAALPVLAASGAPSMALAFGVAGLLVTVRSSHAPARRLTPWIAASMLLAAALASALHAWRWRAAGYASLQEVALLLRLLAWFTWPAWPLALWTLWRWRSHWRHRHIAVPLVNALVGLGACIAMGASDRALMLAVPAIAVLAAFALPTLKRSLSAAIDWFSVCFFSVAALTIWVIYVSMQTGVPAQPLANVLRLAPGFVPRSSPFTVFVALAGTLAWLWLVKWRTGRHRHALWKSLVLPASGVALCWLLLMTLWLPLLDYARSFRPLVVRIARHVPQDACIAAPGLTRAQLAALEYHGRYRVDGRPGAEHGPCHYLLRSEAVRRPPPAPAGWTLVARERRPTDRDERIAIFRR